jgi:hypothetical protein
VVFYVQDAEGNWVTVKLDYNSDLEITDPSQPASLADEIEGLLGEGYTVVGYSIKGGSEKSAGDDEFTHVLINEDGSLQEVDTETMEATVEDPNGVEDNTHVTYEGSYDGSSVTIEDVGTVEESSELTFSGLFGSESLFGEGEGSGGGNGGEHGNPHQPDLGNLVDGGDGSDS